MSAHAPRSIVWLASYPKSGNTWMRAMLSAYQDGGAVNLDALWGGWGVRDREAFDDYMGVSSSDLTPDEVDARRPAFHMALAQEAAAPWFVKLHDAWRRTPAGAPVFEGAVSRGCVYLVRNPLDVAVSFAHHRQTDLDRTIAFMADEAAALDLPRRGIRSLLPERMSSWSGHVQSWLDQTEIRILVLRYEDMLREPAGALEQVVAFAGLNVDAGRLAMAADAAAFDRLKALEESEGFREKPDAKAAFFREGRAGGWRQALSRAQVARLVEDHRAVMASLGYLEEAQAFLESELESEPAKGPSE